MRHRRHRAGDRHCGDCFPACADEHDYARVGMVGGALKHELRHFLPNGEQIDPPEPYKTVFGTVTARDSWFFSQFPFCPVFMRHYVKGEFWPCLGFVGKRDEDVWVQVNRMNDYMRTRIPLGVHYALMDRAGPPPFTN